jgi:RIO kinase 1
MADLEINDLDLSSDYSSDEETTTSNQTKDKQQILAKYSHKIKTDELSFKQKQLSKDKSDRATVENVLDPRTIGFIVSLMNKGTITKINGCLSTGKEANVYHAEDELNGKEYAVKVYKTSILVFKDRERYVDGEFRFRNSRSQHNPRKMIKVWAEKEFRNLKRLNNSGLNSPEPIALKSHVLVMEFLSKGDGFPSPKLKDYPFKDLDDITHYYYEMIYSIRYMFQKCRLVHADLSEYNSIVHQGELYIFDVSQSVEPEHPMSLDFLRMDIKNVNDFFMRCGIDVIPERLIFKFVIDHSSSLGFVEDSKQEWLDYIKQMPLKSLDPKEIENDEVFRSIHLVRSLNHLEERDFQKFTEGKIDTMRDLVGDGKEQKSDREDEESERDEESDSDFDSDDSDYDSDENEETTEKRKKEKPLIGKKHEDRDSKKLRKQQTKEDAREKRKTKVKKHVKKKLIKKRKGK